MDKKKTYDARSVTITSPDKEEKTLSAIFEVETTEEDDVEYLNMLFGNDE